MVSQLENIEPGAESDKMSRVIYDMWQQLPANQKKSIKDMAVAERADSSNQNDMEGNTCQFPHTNTKGR